MLPNEDSILSFSIFKLLLAVISYFVLTFENTHIGSTVQFILCELQRKDNNYL